MVVIMDENKRLPSETDVYKSSVELHEIVF